MNLPEKVALITGAGRGIGKAVALELAKAGCRLVLAARNEAELANTRREVEKMGAPAFAYASDLSGEKNIRDLVTQTLDKFKTLDILINNAGIILPKPFLEVTLEEWDRTMTINLRTVFLLSQLALNVMREKRSGYIINISSTVALGVPPQLCSYGASKLGMVGLAHSLYETAKEYGVKVSTVYPGITDTQMVRDINPPTQPEQWMLPEDIAYCVMFLLKQSDRMIVKDIIPWSTGYDRI